MVDSGHNDPMVFKVVGWVIAALVGVLALMMLVTALRVGGAKDVWASVALAVAAVGIWALDESVRGGELTEILRRDLSQDAFGVSLRLLVHRLTFLSSPESGVVGPVMRWPACRVVPSG